MLMTDATPELSFEDFYQKYYPIALRFLLRRCASTADAEDLAEQVFLYCYQNWKKYDPAKASLSSWLFMILISRFKNYCRDRRYVEDIEACQNMLCEESPIDQAMRLSEIRQRLAQALNALPINQRKAVVLRYFGGLRDEEIARRLGTTSGNVRVLIFRGLRKMRKIFIIKKWSEKP